MTEELALINCRQKKEICGDAIIWDTLTYPEATSSGVKSDNGNFSMQDKFNKDSTCGGSNTGSVLDWSAGVADLPACKAKCFKEGKDKCNNLLYIGTGTICKAYTGTCD